MIPIKIERIELIDVSLVTVPPDPNCRIVEARPDSDGVIRPRSVAEDPDAG